MDTRDFGTFLSRIRKARGLTQAGLAEQLHVTDKAVSRWERGIGLPDINTLEPLADALGLSLSDLMHCHDPEQDRETTAAPLEDFFSMLRRETIDWHSVRTTLLWLSIALALWGIFTHPGTVAVHWHGTGNGDFCADGWMASYLIFHSVLQWSFSLCSFGSSLSRPVISATGARPVQSSQILCIIFRRVSGLSNLRWTSFSSSAAASSFPSANS